MSVYLEGISESVIEKAKKIRLLVLDVDGVLTDGRLYFDASGTEMKAFSTRDGLGIKALQRCGIKVALITGRSSSIVARRADELAIEYVYQGCDDKRTAAQALLQKTGLNAGQMCYAGDDWVDLPVLTIAGLSVAPADADPLVRRNVNWVCPEKGGKGAVRSLCNLILAAQGQQEKLLQELLQT